MKTIILIGSRNHEGKTARAVAALAEGLAEGKAEVETVFLTEKNIERCRQTDRDGWGTCIKQGSCEIKDDFPALVGELRQADLFVFATPVYWGDLSESMRAFLDRLRRTCIHDNGKKGIAGKPAIGICVAGGGGGGSPRCVDALQHVLGHCGIDVFDVVPARRQNLDLKLVVLRETGRWLAANPAVWGNQGGK